MIDGYDGQVLTKAALRLVALTYVRTSELIEAKRSEFDFAKAEWNIPEERMKARRPHFVPLSRQSVAVFDELRALTGNRIPNGRQYEFKRAAVRSRCDRGTTCAW